MIRQNIGCRQSTEPMMRYDVKGGCNARLQKPLNTLHQRLNENKAENRSNQRRPVIDKIKEENVMYKRIGSTTYKIRLHFKNEGETMEDKILRLIKYEVSQSKPLREVS